MMDAFCTHAIYMTDALLGRATHIVAAPLGHALLALLTVPHTPFIYMLELDTARRDERRCAVG